MSTEINGSADETLVLTSLVAKCYKCWKFIEQTDGTDYGMGAIENHLLWHPVVVVCYPSKSAVCH